MNDDSRNPARSKMAGLSHDFFLGLAIFVFGVLLLLLIIPSQVDDAGSFGLPPSLAPRSLALVMITCGAVLSVQNLRSSTVGLGLRLNELVYMLSCLLAVGLMLVLMSFVGDLLDRPNAGFLISAPIGMIIFTFLHSSPPLWAFAFNAIVAPLIIVAAFWWGLELPLP